MSEPVIGIDLGTTYSTVAYFDETGRPTIMPGIDGRRPTPSVIGFSVSGETIKVGNRSNWSFSKFKRQMHDPNHKQYKGDDGKTYNAMELSSFVLAKLKKDAETYLNQKVKKAIITVPANFPNKARTATLEAAKMAGLEPMRVINEPTAAAIYHSFNRKNSGKKPLNGTYAFFDLGGGTFDISIAEVKGLEVRLLWSEGIAKLGGSDFDFELLNLVKKDFLDEAGQDLNEDSFRTKHAEDAKKDLSEDEAIEIPIISEVARTRLTMERSRFEEKISPLIAQTEMCCLGAIEKAKEKIEEEGGNWKGVDEVFLVGGSTRIPFSRKYVEKIFNKKPTIEGNPDESVALGAAILAASENTENLNVLQSRAIEGFDLSEVAVKCFGTISFNLRIRELQNSTIIEKGQSIPTSVTKTFFLNPNPAEYVECDVTECDIVETDPDQVLRVWESRMDLPDSAEGNDEIEITYTYNADQTMECKFVHVRSGTSITDVLDLEGDTKPSWWNDDIDIDDYSIE